jgi:hypothetical protein
LVAFTTTAGASVPLISKAKAVTMELHIAGLEGSSISGALFFAVVILAIVQRIVSNHLYNKKYKFPPRIPGLPIVGNTFQLPLSQQGKWGIVQAKKYGEMCVLSFLFPFIDNY